MIEPLTLEEIEAEEARRCRASLAFFVKTFWQVFDPATKLKWSWPMDAICDHVQALLEGKLGRNNLIVSVPPGTSKSTITSVCAPAWAWCQSEHETLGPSWRALFISGSDDVALRDAVKCRDVIESDIYQRLFRPDWTLTRDQNAKGFYKNTRAGFRMSISAGSRITGNRADAIFVDDPNDAKQIFSAPYRAEVNQWWDQAAANRLNDLATGKRCIIQQRLHTEDLTGHVLAKNGDRWDRLVIRQKYEVPKEDDPDAKPTGLGWVDPRKEVGALMFPERFPARVIEEEEISLGAAGFAGQHQQRPSPEGGNIIKLDWLRQTYKVLPDTPGEWIQSWDPKAGSKDPKSSYVVGQVWFRPHSSRGRLYLVDQVRAQWDIGETMAAINALTAKHPQAYCKIIEEKADGKAIISMLKSQVVGMTGTSPAGDKAVRLRAVAPMFEAGNVWLPDPSIAPWVGGFILELTTFPAAPNDDQVDACSQALAHFGTAPTPGVY